MSSPLLRIGAALSAASLLAPLAAAQGEYVFQLDRPASHFVWTGTTSLGPLEGNPDNDFNLNGTLTAAVDSDSTSLLTGEVLEADALVVPDIHAKIPNTFDFLPPLATIDILGLRLSVESDVFAVGAGGGFTTTATVTVLEGTMVVTPLGGSAESTDLTGSQSDPETVSGTLAYDGSTMDFDAPVAVTFHFSDSGSGVSGTVTLTGDIVAAFDCPAPVSYCTGAPNSVGPGAEIAVTGSTSVIANATVLNATALPPGQNGLFFYGPSPIDVPFGNGHRCVGGSLFRLPVQTIDAFGFVSLPLDVDDPPAASGQITGGSTWYFQFWYRDPAAGGAFFNLTDGAEVFFCP